MTIHSSFPRSCPPPPDPEQLNPKVILACLSRGAILRADGDRSVTLQGRHPDRGTNWTVHISRDVFHALLTLQLITETESVAAPDGFTHYAASFRLPRLGALLSAQPEVHAV